MVDSHIRPITPEVASSSLVVPARIYSPSLTKKGFFISLSIACCFADFASAQKPTHHSPRKAVDLLWNSLLELISNDSGAMARHADHH